MISQSLIQKLDVLIALHRKNNDMWVDFFESAREKILKDVAFGCEYLSMAWHGIGGYDNERIFSNDADEETRRSLHPEIYKLSIENKKNDQH